MSRSVDEHLQGGLWLVVGVASFDEFAVTNIASADERDQVRPVDRAPAALSRRAISFNVIARPAALRTWLAPTERDHHDRASGRATGDLAGISARPTFW